jgi:hypothetical protein
MKNIYQKLKDFYNKRKRTAIITFIIALLLWWITIPALLVAYIWGNEKISRRYKMISIGAIAVVILIVAGSTSYSQRPPVITITSPQDGYTVQAKEIEIKGNITPKNSQMTLNGFLPVSIDSKGNFTAKFILKSETNTARIEATNIGKTVSKSITVNRTFTEQEKLDIKLAAEKAQKEAEAQAAKAKAEQEAYERTPAGRVCTKHPTWTTEMCEAIGKGKIGVGMTEDQVKAAWGNPRDINRTTTAYGSREQWVYSMSSYVYLDDGVVTAIQN